ncbi:MAG: HPP family protein [Burkholderiaceae bacterium]
MTPRSRRQRIGIKGELLLALMPMATVLLVLFMVEALSNQRLLFASLASSAFLIYLEPEHTANNVRTLLLAQIGAAALGFLCYLLLGPGYLSGGTAMVLAIALMIATDSMHPPAVSSALSFGLRSGDESNLMLFCLAAGITAVLVILQRVALWSLRRIAGRAGQ